MFSNVLLLLAGAFVRWVARLSRLFRPGIVQVVRWDMLRRPRETHFLTGIWPNRFLEHAYLVAAVPHVVPVGVVRQSF